MSRKPKGAQGKQRARRGGGHRRARPAQSVVQETLDVRIESLGAQGDGVAHAVVQGRDVPLYVPRALPGELLRVTTIAKRGDGFEAHVEERFETSQHRVTPPCPHYEFCGGCAAQHMSAAFYADWKQQRIADTMAQRGFNTVVIKPPLLMGEGTRRRVTFSALKRKQRIILGFNARASHDIAPIDRCPLVVDALNDLIVPLGETLTGFLGDGERMRISVTSCDNGLDVLIEGGAPPGLLGREALAEFVQSTDVVRLSWKEDDLTPEPIAQEVPPLVYLSGVPVELPQGTFLQASVKGEHAIRDAVLSALGEGSVRMADLFCGLGSFSIPLSQMGVVDAFDVTEAPIRALERAAGRADLGGRVKATVRDLHRQPLETKELSKYDAVVFDPPRAGAQDQARQLADADVERIVAVSCNPATFARDARILADGRFELVSVQPIDQFTYSPHVELVASFLRRTKV